MLPEDTGEKSPAPERRPDDKNKEVSLMKKWKMVLTAAMPLAMALSFPAFAGEWQEDMNGWKYQNDDGSYCRNGWYWLDGDHDGWAQCYYFGNTGYAMTDYGRADGYEIDKNGAWSVNGVTQVKSVPTDVEENDPEAMEVYEEAQQLNETLKSENIDVNYRITTSYLDETLDMTMDMNIKMRETEDGNIEFLCDGTSNTLGTEVPIEMFYTGGNMYVDTMGIKYKQPMSLEDAAKQATQLDMNLGTDVIKGLRMYQNGDTKKLAYSINEDKINEVIQAITDATAETYATLGVGMDMKVNEANGEMTINKDGYYENMTIFMDVVMNITDMETSEVDVMNYKIDMNMDCKNPGKEVLFELPSTDGFEELNLLDLTGEEQE